MSADLIQCMEFRGQRAQPLRNVPIYTAAIVWVQRGGKQLKWRDSSLHFGADSWLLVPANQRLTFINQPENGQFRSRVMALLEMPEPGLLQDVPQPWQQPYFEPDTALKFGFETLLQADQQGLSHAVLRHYLQGFYQQLQEAGVLHQLFPAAQLSLSEQLCRYFAADPAAEHNQLQICRHFGLSKATLIRKLAQEGSQFRALLTDVRMSYALAIMQGGKLNQLELALRCGYQSERRFAEGFRAQFGLTPAAYQRTLEQKDRPLVC